MFCENVLNSQAYDEHLYLSLLHVGGSLGFFVKYEEPNTVAAVRKNFDANVRADM